MTTAEQFLKALAMVESSDNPEAWGDYQTYPDLETAEKLPLIEPKPIKLPLAMGRWQVHPDRLFDEMKRFKIQPKLRETWDTLVFRVLVEIFDNAIPLESVASIAMYWHVGHWTHPTDADWDLNYATRFGAAIARIKGTADDNG